MHKRILVIAAHPDDEVLGCGGVICRLKAEDNIVETFLLGKGRGDELDNQFDKKPLLYWVKMIERKISEFQPDIIFTHFEYDLNIDHQITYKAVITATRPMQGETVREIYSFEVLSSTEWAYPLKFSPNVFYDITDFMVGKFGLLEKYKTEMKEFPHPRSVEGIKLSARVWGMKVGMEYAEAFVAVRILK